MDREPVLIILAGLAAVLSTMLVATNALGWTHLDGGQTASVITAVAAFCALVATAIRGQVYAPATVRDALRIARPTSTDPLAWPEEPPVVAEPPVDLDDLTNEGGRP